MIFIDSSIPLALVGSSPEPKAIARRLLERSIAAGERLVTDSLVLQEIQARCFEVDCSEAIEPSFDALLGVVDDVLSVREADSVRAKEIGYGPEKLSPRHSLHVAVMERHGVTRIMSFDNELDRYSGVERIAPG